MPLREAVKLDDSLPLGKIEKNTFTGIRLPMSVSAGDTGWQITTSYPQFMLEQGYSKHGLELSQVFLYHPVSQSNMQISFTPANRWTHFSQEKIQKITGLMGLSIKNDLDQEFGKGAYEYLPGSAEAYPMQGVQYSSRNYVHYKTEKLSRINGWIYAFSEPFQIFILYLVNDPDKNTDHQTIDNILSTFEYIGWSMGQME